ncbi:MAG: hypothetical protein CL927_05770 [Deltaproteobacteria bacterium]|nr:hypothetical protein [Deltaproteobacteria bacterium]
MKRRPLALFSFMPALFLIGCAADGGDGNKADSEPDVTNDSGESDADGGEDGGDDGGSGDGGDSGGDSGGDGDDGSGDGGDGSDGGDDGGDGSGDDGEDIEASEIIFASPTTALADPLTAEQSSFGDLNGDGHLDIISSSDRMEVVWFQGDGAGAFASGDTTDINLGIEAIANAGDAALGFDGEGDRSIFDVAAVPTTGGDRLIVGIQVQNGATREWGVAFGVLEPDGSGRWTASLLQTGRSWGGIMPLADLDGNGVSEILVDVDEALTLFWDGDPGQSEALGSVTSSSIYPAAWTTTVSGTELGFVLGSNWGYGFTEAWSWTPSRGLERIATDFYSSDMYADVRPGFEASSVWLLDGENLFRFESGAPASFPVSTNALLGTQFDIATGNFDGSGRLTAVMDGSEALHVAEDRTLEQMPLQVTDFGYSTRAADINGDGLDDLVNFNTSRGVDWMENISAP